MQIWPWKIVFLIKFTDVRRPSGPWVAPFPENGVLNWKRLRTVSGAKVSNQMRKCAFLSLCS